MQSHERKLSRVSLAAVPFCVFAAYLLHYVKVGSCSCVLVLGEVWGEGHLWIASASFEGLVWHFDDNKDRPSPLGRFSDGGFCSGLFGRHWLADGASLDLAPVVLVWMQRCARLESLCLV